MKTTYTVGGMGTPSGGLSTAMASLFPKREAGPNVNVQVTFPNGIRLSLVYGWGAYCGLDTVEVAVFPAGGGEWMTQDVAEAVFGEEIGDDVDGYCDADRVHAYFLAAQHWGEI